MLLDLFPVLLRNHIGKCTDIVGEAGGVEHGAHVLVHEKRHVARTADDVDILPRRIELVLGLVEGLEPVDIVHVLEDVVFSLLKCSRMRLVLRVEERRNAEAGLSCALLLQQLHLVVEQELHDPVRAAVAAAHDIDDPALSGQVRIEDMKALHDTVPVNGVEIALVAFLIEHHGADRELETARVLFVEPLGGNVLHFLLNCRIALFVWLVFMDRQAVVDGGVIVRAGLRAFSACHGPGGNGEDGLLAALIDPEPCLAVGGETGFECPQENEVPVYALRIIQNLSEKDRQVLMPAYRVAAHDHGVARQRIGGDAIHLLREKPLLVILEGEISEGVECVFSEERPHAEPVRLASLRGSFIFCMH